MSESNVPDSLDEALADCLDAMERGDPSIDEKLARYPKHAEDLAELVSLTRALTSLGQVSPRREFAESAVPRLLDRLSDHPTPLRAWLSRVWRWRLPLCPVRAGTLISALLVLAAVLFLGQGLLHAAAAAAPGELLYGVQLRLEHVPLLVTSDAEASARIHLALAGKRLAEAQDQLNRDDVERALVALQAYEMEIMSVTALIREAQGPDKSSLRSMLDSARSEHLDTLNVLLQSVPEDAQAAIQRAIDVGASAGGPPASAPTGQPTAIPDVVEPAAEPGPSEDPPEIPEGGAAPETSAAPADPPDPPETAAPPETCPTDTDPPEMAVPPETDAPPEATAPPEAPPPAVDPPVPPDATTPPETPAAPPGSSDPPADGAPPTEPGHPLELPGPPEAVAPPAVAPPGEADAADSSTRTPTEGLLFEDPGPPVELPIPQEGDGPSLKSRRATLPDRAPVRNGAPAGR